MLFLHISKAAGNYALLDKYVNEGKCVFVLIYMDGCGPCNATRPEWAKLKHTLSGKYKHDNNVVIADVNSDALEGIKHIQNIRGFPTMRMICKRGKLKEDFEEGKHLNKARTVDAFIEWIELHMKREQQQHQPQPALKTTLMHMQSHAFQNNNHISRKRKKPNFNNKKKSNRFNPKYMHKKTRRHKKRHHGK
jgi:thioredoxin-like negative regulator of GroEL